VILSPENMAWLSQFKNDKHRPPRILHIGNIANNAYNNTKLMNEAGLDCDVICYDYYHIMGCPEWEDADLTGGWQDDFHPEWTKVDLQGFARPAWFVQGPLALCLDYLRASRSPNQSDMSVLRAALAHFSRYRVRSLVEHFNPITRVYSEAFIKFKRLILSDQSTSINALQKYFERVAGSNVLLLMSLCLPILLAVRVGLFPVVAIVRYFRRNYSVAQGCISPQCATGPTAIDLIEVWRWQFPERADSLSEADLLQYLGCSSRWREVLSLYDYVISYSTDPIIPLACGVPYFAFEHGTIREIPYEATPQGRLTSLAYRMASHVFVTNFDCVGSAEKLAPGRFTIINHPYDEDHGLKVENFDSLRQSLHSELDCDLIFFHPTRQDWVAGTGYADKSNDVFLRAFGELRRQGFRVGMVACAWGANVVESKALLEEFGCSCNVRWVAPMAITPFERMCRATDIVVDQFKLGAFGGVVFKAMAVGTPILTYLDEDRLARQYPQCPPVVNCRTTDEIIGRVKGLIVAPDELVRAGAASRAWMKAYHAKDMTVNAQIDQFRRHPPISASASRI